MRLTPLNILTSVILVCIAYLMLNADREGWRILGSITLLILAVLSFFTDLVFRRFIKDIKRIWIIESVFIIFVAILIAIFQRY